MCEAVRKYDDERQTIGRVEGRIEDKQEERLKTIRKAVKMKMPIGTIAELVWLPVEEVRKLIAELEQ